VNCNLHLYAEEPSNRLFRSYLYGVVGLLACNIKGIEMKIIWELFDVKGGLRVKKENCSEIWMIGYNPIDDSKTLVSLSDGLISCAGSAQKISEELNKLNYTPIMGIK